jgi:regulator of sigma E protease
MQIVTSEGRDIDFTIERPGEAQPLTLTSHFNIPDTRWWQRKALRQIGIGPETGWVLVGAVMSGSPAEDAGVKAEDRIVSVDAQEFKSSGDLVDYIRSKGESPMNFVLDRKKKLVDLTIRPEVPLKPEGKNPMIGVSFADSPVYENLIIHPGPIEQISDTLEMMWVTIARVISPSSSLGIGHLSGPVGIAKLQYRMLNMDHPWQRILAFMVLFNVNLAVLNMLPFPVLDGGHITLALLEKIFGRPVKAKPLEILQTACALMLISLMLFVTSKDIGDDFGRGSDVQEEIVFPAD